MGRPLGDEKLKERHAQALQDGADGVEMSIATQTLLDLENDPRFQYEKTHWELLREDVSRSKRPKTMRQAIAEHVRAIGTEWDEELQTTRLDAAVRSMYLLAQSGGRNAVAAFTALMDRGWGKVPQAIEVDARSVIEKRIEELGLTMEDLQSDPLALQLFQAVGISLSMVPKAELPPSSEDKG